MDKRDFGSGMIKSNYMEQMEEIHAQQTDSEPLIVALANELSLSKAELVECIECRLGELLRRDLIEAFEVVAAKQNIKGGMMNIDRAHKSVLVILAHVLNNAEPTHQH